MGNNLFEMKRCRLTTVSPIHIGSVDQKLTPFEYITAKEKIYFISDEKLSRFLGKKNLIDPYVRAVSIEGYKFRLSNFFKEKGINLTEKDLLEISGGRFANVTGDVARLQDFRPFIRDGNGEIFIPGSSIKGVFKTAVIFEVLKELRDKKATDFTRIIENRISSDISNKKNKKFFFEWGMEEWFESFVLNNKSRSPNTDWFRMLHVTDAYPVEEIKTSILPISIIKKEKNGWQFKTEGTGVNTIIWAECIPAHAVFEFQISWDHKLLEIFEKQNSNKNKILPDNINQLTDALKNWSKDTKDFEKTFSTGHSLQNWYSKNNPNFRIGFGSGMVSTTIIQLLPERLRKDVRNFAGLDRGNDEAPKSRRVWMSNGQAIPLGWAVLEVLPFDPKEPLFSRTTKVVSMTEALEKKEEEQTPIQAEKPTEKKQPEQRTISNVTIIYNPGNRSLSATIEGKKAFVEHIDDKFVPERLWPKLKKDKKITASIIVEPIGNAFRIVAFAEQ